MDLLPYNSRYYIQKISSLDWEQKQRVADLTVKGTYLYRTVSCLNAEQENYVLYEDIYDE